MRIKVDNRPTTRSWVVAPSPQSKLEQISQPLTFATPFERPTFTSPFDVSDSPPPTPLSPLPISPPSPPSLTPPTSLSPPPPTPVDLNVPEHHGTTAGAHYNRQYHPYTFQRRSISPLLPGEVGASAGEQGDKQASAIPLSSASPMSRMTHTITSTVSVGFGNAEVANGGNAARRRSSTISVPSRLLRKKDKEKDKGKGKKRENEQEMERERMTDVTKGKGRERALEREDDNTTLKGSTSSKDTTKAKLASVSADPATTSVISTYADPDIELMQGVVHDSFHPPPPAPQRPSSSSTTTLKHTRSQSNLQRGTSRCGETASNGTISPSSSSLSHISTREPTTQDPGTSAAAAAPAAPGGSRGKKRSKIVRGVSVHAERFVRGLDSALDFVDGRAGS
jgi:hypothetical protein